jgi:hypothetical protein
MSADPKQYKAFFDGIGEQAAELEVKFESGNFTSRDLALLVDLWGKYVDGLESLYDEGIKIEPTEYIVQGDGKKFRFQTDEQMSEFIADLLGAPHAAI